MPASEGRVIRSVARILAIVAVAGVLLGCPAAPEGEERRLDTIDVEKPPEIDYESDPQAVPRAPSLSGILPGDFPEGVPLFLPASIVDLGSDANGRRVVSLLTSESPGVVEAQLGARARSAGWTFAPDGDGHRLSRGGVEVGLRVEDGEPGTLYHLSY